MDRRPQPQPDETSRFYGGTIDCATRGPLAEGRLHGISFLNEAVLQPRGQSERRQVPDAQVAVVTSGLFMQCGAMVLTAA